MLRRKAAIALPSNHPLDILSKTKWVPWCSPDDKKGDIDCSSPDTLIQSVLADIKVAEFFDNYWEKKPLLVKRANPNFYGELFTLSVIKDIVQSNALGFRLGMNVSTFVDGQYKDFTEEPSTVGVETIEKLMDQSKASFQFNHPQRYIDELWNISEKMETYFGSLVDADAYITPPGCQGAVPHCDDVENFIFQIEGEEEWKLYKPMVELCRDYTQDMPEDSIGEPILEVLLEPGDLLYFPRGIIYQCKTTASSHSTRIVLSTYQQNTRGDFLGHVVQQAIEKALEDNVCIRSGLPINYQSYLGTGRNMGAYVTDPDDDEKNEKCESKENSNLCDPKVMKFKETVQSCLSELVNHIDINKAADSMCAEFMSSRLPPYGHCRCMFDHTKTTVGTEEVKTTVETMEEVEVKTTEGMEEVVTTVETMEKVETTVEEIEKVETTVEAIEKVETTVEAMEKVETTVEAMEKVETTVEAMEDMFIKQVIPTINNKIKLKYPDHIRVIYADDEDEDSDDSSDDESMDDDSIVEGMEQEDNNGKQGLDEKPQGTPSEEAVQLPSETCDEDDEDAEVTNTEPHIKVLHSLHNNRFSHMGCFNVFEKEGSLKFDVAYAKALVKLMNSNDFIAVRDLLMDEDDEKVLLATRLAGDGLLEVKTD